MNQLKEKLQEAGIKTSKDIMKERLQEIKKRDFVEAQYVILGTIILVNFSEFLPLKGRRGRLVRNWILGQLHKKAGIYEVKFMDSERFNYWIKSKGLEEYIGLLQIPNYLF